MGMFDEIRCDAPLPDGHDAAGDWFQSKSFPDCCMCRYRITEGGRLIGPVNASQVRRAGSHFFARQGAASAA